MRTRDKSLSDYGIDCSRAAELVELARLEENKGLICKAADLSNPGLSTFIIESLTQKKGYDRIYNELPRSKLRGIEGCNLYI